MLGKVHNAGLIAFALVGLVLAAPSWAKNKDYTKDKSSKDYSSKDYSSKDYSSKDSKSSSKDYASLNPSDPNAKSSSSTVKLSSTEKYMLHIHDVLASSEDEWTVLRPRVEKVVTLQREVTAGRDPKGPRPPSSKDLARLAEGTTSSKKPTSEVSDATKALNVALADQAARLQELRMSIAAARDARAKAKSELTRAQEDLRGLLTVRQEAAMIVMGLLD